MERRRLLCVLIAIPAAVLASCSPGDNDALDACGERDKNTRNYIEQVDSALDDVETDLNKFDAEDWQDALSDLRGSIDSLRQIVDDMKQELDS